MDRIAVLVSGVSDIAIEGTLIANLRYIGEDEKKALDIAANIIDWLTLNDGWKVIDEGDNFCVLRNGHWYKTVEIKYNV